MVDRLDDQLRQVPIEAMPPDLPGRVQSRLRRQRSSERRRQILFDAAMMCLVVSGALALRPQVGSAGGWWPNSSTVGSFAWIGRFGSDPAQATWQALTGVVGWTQRVAEDFNVGGLLGLVLLAIPLFVWLRRLMPDATSSDEGLGGGMSGVIEEGVSA